MTLSIAQSAFLLAALAVAAGLWAAHISVNSATRGPDWAMSRLPGEYRWSLLVLAVGLIATLVVQPIWFGLGVAYLAVVVAWTARALLKGLQRLGEVGAYEPLPVGRQAALVGRVGFWLLTVAVLGIGVAIVDIESRGGVAYWDLLLVGLVAAAGIMYRRRAAAMLGDFEPSE